MKKTVTIEELLTWAFVDELPKGGGVEGLVNPNSAWRMLEASSWGKINSFAELLAVVDRGRGDATNFFIEQGAPHDDALAVGEVVMALARCDVGFPEAWNPLGDWPSGDTTAARLAGEAVAAARAAFMLRTPPRRAAHLVNLVVGQAILGGAPDWVAEPPKLRMVERHGRPAWFVRRGVMDPTTGATMLMEVDGYDVRRGRPVPGAYRRHEFADDPRGDILGRLDYQLWVAALRRLAATVRPSLMAHRLLPCDLSPTPWMVFPGAGVLLIEACE